MKHNIYEFSLFSKILCFLFKGSLNIPEYRCLLIGRVQYLYTLEHAVENIANHRFQSISVTLLSLEKSKLCDVVEMIQGLENQSLWERLNF